MLQAVLRHYAASPAAKGSSKKKHLAVVLRDAPIGDHGKCEALTNLMLQRLRIAAGIVHLPKEQVDSSSDGSGDGAVALSVLEEGSKHSLGLLSVSFHTLPRPPPLGKEASSFNEAVEKLRGEWLAQLPSADGSSRVDHRRVPLGDFGALAAALWDAIDSSEGDDWASTSPEESYLWEALGSLCMEVRCESPRIV